MKSTQYIVPEAFVSSPFLSLLPGRGKVSKLQALTPSLFARYEKVAAHRESVSEEDPETMRRVRAEYAMLRQVLEWLEVNLEEQEGGE